MLKDPLRFWAIISQALGFTLIIFLETWMGRAQAGYWQLRVLLVMIAIALVIAVLRLYQNKRWQKEQERRRQLLREEEEDTSD
ncbi:hypothetical protein SAMN05660443_1997 [Marinospirillum celere]|uniref:Uncharacterized protein n=1 Tax=Marinospirillum celere TaxID=1122252 RepID=A0A1I1HSQ5_9GAMM|nr:hypothetical protein [Marinospirillum celere]SFC26835.1 hypothetical protein SAMN05660443_1997 [Marinospirillum celere]